MPMVMLVMRIDKRDKMRNGCFLTLFHWTPIYKHLTHTVIGQYTSRDPFGVTFGHFSGVSCITYIIHWSVQIACVSCIC